MQENDKAEFVAVNIKCPRELREEFAALCNVNQVPMSVALRSLMVSAVENAKTGRSMNPLFSRPAPTVIKV